MPTNFYLGISTCFHLTRTKHPPHLTKKCLLKLGVVLLSVFNPIILLYSFENIKEKTRLEAKKINIISLSNLVKSFHKIRYQFVEFLSIDLTLYQRFIFRILLGTYWYFMLFLILIHLFQLSTRLGEQQDYSKVCQFICQYTNNIFNIPNLFWSMTWSWCGVACLDGSPICVAMPLQLECVIQCLLLCVSSWTCSNMLMKGMYNRTF